MPLSKREQRILSEIEGLLNRQYPELADLFRGPPPASPRRHPLSGASLGRLVVVLVSLVLVHPLAASWGAGGVGLLTTALIVPWMVEATRTAGRLRRRPHRGGSDVATTSREHRVPRLERAALPVVLTLWALAVAVLVACRVALSDAALVAAFLVMVVGVPVVQWFARRALSRRFGPTSGETGAELRHRED